MPNALIMETPDDVAVMTTSTAAGECVVCIISDNKLEVTSAQDIPMYHKIALREIPKGSVVRKYGNIIGEATQDIPAGAHVHTHNIDSTNKEG